MSARQLLPVINVFATDMTDAKRQANVALHRLIKYYNDVELLDVVCTSFSWEMAIDYPKLYMFRIIYSVTL